MPRRGRKLKPIPQQSISNGKQKERNGKESSTTSASTVCSVSGHSSNIMDRVKRDKQHCDAVIEAGGEKFKIHKSVFAIYSDYFDKVCTVEMHEKYDNVVKLEGIRCDVMKCIIDFVYTGKLSIIRENAVKLLMAAHYLRIEKIKKFSVKFLLRNVDPENCISVWLCARTYDLRDLLEKSATIFGSNLTSVAHDELCWLSNDQFLEMIESTTEVRKSEEDSFTAATIWANHDVENRKEMFSKIFRHLDASLFSKDFLTTIARNESLVLTSAKSMHKVALELITRLEKIGDEEEMANYRIAEIKGEQVLAKKTDSLAYENRRLTERVQSLASYSQQASRKIDSLTKELLSFERNAHQASLQLRASTKTIDSLTKQNKLLTSQVQKVSGEVHYDESQAKVPAARAAAPAIESKRLAERGQKNDGLGQQQAESYHKASEKKINTLTEENKSLTERVHKNKIVVQQLEHQLKTEEKRNDELIRENKILLNSVRKSEDCVNQSDFQIGALEANLERLNERVYDYENEVENAEDERRELEMRSDKLHAENHRLTIQIETETQNVRKAKSKVLALEKGIGDYVKENQQLSALADNLSTFLRQTQDKLQLYVEQAHSARKEIEELISISSKS